jgi:hypothetical protein
MNINNEKYLALESKQIRKIKTYIPIWIERESEGRIAVVVIGFVRPNWDNNKDINSEAPGFVHPYIKLAFRDNYGYTTSSKYQLANRLKAILEKYFRVDVATIEIP